jgi:hypothetical protein
VDHFVGVGRIGEPFVRKFDSVVGYENRNNVSLQFCERTVERTDERCKDSQASHLVACDTHYSDCFYGLLVLLRQGGRSLLESSEFCFSGGWEESIYINHWGSASLLPPKATSSLAVE